MRAKQKRSIQLAEENIPDLSNVPDILFKANYLRPLGILEIKEDKNALSPEECFFNWQSKGIKPEATSDVRRLARLMWGHRRIALNRSMHAI